MSKLKIGGGCLGAHMCAYNVFFKNVKFMGQLLPGQKL
jgi:hypothetical protein